MKTNKIIFILVIVFLTFNCASVKAPKDWLPEPEKISEDVYGAWIALRLNDSGDHHFFGGEFICYEEKKIYLLNENGLSKIEIKNIKEAVIDLYQRETNTLALWTVGGILSTASHGFFLIVSAPIWLVSGIINSAIASHSGRFAQDDPDELWFEEMKKYSRFPEGLPKDVDLNTLKPKPYSIE